jgi:hypothetical protein
VAVLSTYAAPLQRVHTPVQYEQVRQPSGHRGRDAAAPTVALPLALLSLAAGDGEGEGAAAVATEMSCAATDDAHAIARTSARAAAPVHAEGLLLAAAIFKMAGALRLTCERPAERGRHNGVISRECTPCDGKKA